MNVFWNWWTQLDPSVQGGLYGSMATILAACVAAGIVMHQVRAALRQSRDAEAVRLKLSVYNGIVAEVASIEDVSADFSGKVRILLDQAEVAAFPVEPGQLPSPIPTTFQEMLAAEDAAVRRAIGIVSLVERWQIIDPRLFVFQIAVNAALDELRRAFTAYVPAIIPYVRPPPGVAIPKGYAQLLPDDRALAEIRKCSAQVLDAMIIIDSYTSDFLREMQMALLGDLFPNKLPPREPLDPQSIVISLDRHDDLIAHFENSTDWGRRQAALLAEVAARYKQPTA